MFDIEEFIIAVYLCVDSRLKGLIATYPPRSKGFAPGLSDSEVLTMEIVGEMLGQHRDIEIWRYFHRHWRHWFPKLPHRSNFVRQATNLWQYKQQLHQILLSEMEAKQSDLYRVDGFPLPVCNFKRAKSATIFRGEASYGKSATKLGTFYGFRGHLCVNAQGLIIALEITAADVDERAVVPELVSGLKGVLLGDKGYLSQSLQQSLAQQQLTLLTPMRSNMKQYNSEYNRFLSRDRQMVETVIGHLQHWFEIESVHARDLWHLTSRLARKILAHTLMAFFNLTFHRPLLQFDGLLAD